MTSASSGSCYSNVLDTTDQTLHFTKRKSLTWYSLLYTQWMNYGMICLSLVANPKGIYSAPFHNKSMTIKLCLDQVNKLWSMLMTDFNLSLEERDRLVCTGTQNMYKVG